MVVGKDDKTVRREGIARELGAKEKAKIEKKKAAAK
jgi:large subunit ribosomal protein L24